MVEGMCNGGSNIALHQLRCSSGKLGDDSLSCITSLQGQISEDVNEGETRQHRRLLISFTLGINQPNHDIADKSYSALCLFIHKFST